MLRKVLLVCLASAVSLLPASAGPALPDDLAWAPAGSDHEALRGYEIRGTGTVFWGATVETPRGPGEETVSSTFIELHTETATFCFLPPAEAATWTGTPPPPSAALVLAAPDGSPALALLNASPATEPRGSGATMTRHAIRLMAVQPVDCPEPPGAR